MLDRESVKVFEELGLDRRQGPPEDAPDEGPEREALLEALRVAFGLTTAFVELQKAIAERNAEMATMWMALVRDADKILAEALRRATEK